MELEYTTAYKRKEIIASTLDEFIGKVRELTKDGEEISTIGAIVVTHKHSNPITHNNIKTE